MMRVRLGKRTMSLRLRLFLSFVAVAIVMAGLGLVALQYSWKIQRQVTDLTSVSIARFERDKAVGQALEIEVEPGPAGSWFADEMEVLGGPRRPKLRGPIQDVDPVRGLIRMFGVSIAVSGEVAASDLPPGGLEGLAEGDRLEISCTINDDGGWLARKIRTRDIKSSDKIKGTVTEVSMDGMPPDSLAISGIMILFDFTSRNPNPRVELKRISLANRMTMLVQDCVLAARRTLAGAGEVVMTPDGDLVEPEILLSESVADLIEAVDRARAVNLADPEDPLGLDETLWLDPLASHVESLEELVDKFLGLYDHDPDAAWVLLDRELEPLLMDRIRPLVHHYLLDAEESLAAEVDHLSTQAGATARALVVASVLALVCALAVGRGVWRSISKPLQRLTSAAVRIGQGHLDTRVAVTSRDELGMLAETLNRMASDLESSTVSLANLNDILESIAGALFVLDARGIITSANQAASELTGTSSELLKGKRLTELCEPTSGVQILPIDKKVSGGEGQLSRSDGTLVPVSFSGAALRSGEGPVGGFVWIAQSLSDRIAMEDQLRRSLAEKELLLREVHHRVKNNLQVISSLLELQADSIEDPRFRAVYEDSQSRIRSMALIHQQLYGASELDKINFQAYLDQLAGSLFQFHGNSQATITIKSSAAPVQLGIDRALTCGLIINELVTNALKHAFNPGQQGTVTVEFRTVEDRHVLTVSDDGVGLSGNPPSSDSLGMSLVSALVEQLRGEMKVSSGSGATFEILFPEDEVMV